MSRLGGALKTRVGLEVEVKGKGMGDTRIDHRTRRQVAGPVLVAVIGSEESHAVLGVSLGRALCDLLV